MTNHDEPSPKPPLSPEQLEATLTATYVDQDISPDSLSKTVAESTPPVDRHKTVPQEADTNLDISRQALHIAGDQKELSRDSQKRYRITGLLGEGGNAQVFAAHDANFDREVAIKIAKSGQPSTSPKLQSFVREAQVTAKLEHPGVLPVYDLDVTHTGEVYFSMRKVQGTTLGHLIRECKRQPARHEKIATPNDCINIVLRICDALSYAHNRGIIHQDVKPDNVMIGDFGEVTLADWGTAKLKTKEPANKGKYVGTPAFMSPEQARKESADERSDIYAIGATLYQMLTLCYPTWDSDVKAFWEKKTKGIIDALPKATEHAIPKRLLAITNKALAADINQRYQQVEELAQELRSYQQGMAISAYKDNVLDVLSRWYHRHQRVIVSSVVAVILIGIASYYGITQHQKEQTIRKQLESQREEGWIEVGEWDFSKMTEIPPDFEIAWRRESWPLHQLKIDPNRATFQDNTLTLVPNANRTLLRYTKTLPEEIKAIVEIDNTPKTGLNCGISISGDTRYGYRVRIINYRHIELETFHDGVWVVHQSANLVLDRNKPSFTFEYYRTGNEFNLKVDGVQVFKFHEPMAKKGERYRGFALSRYAHSGPSRYTSLKLYKRVHPEVIDIIEPGRIMLHSGHRKDALAWFDKVIKEQSNDTIRHEAELMYALSLPAKSPDKHSTLKKVAKDIDNPFRSHALRALSFMELENNNLSASFSYMQAVSVLDPSSGGPAQLAGKFRRRLLEMDRDEAYKALTAFGKIRVPIIRFYNNKAEDLDWISNPVLRVFNMPNAGIKNIDGLRGKPIQELSIPLNQIEDISALAGAPLFSLNIEQNNISDISPLKNSPLELLEIGLNNVADISAVKHLKQLRLFKFNNNPVADISPLKGLPLQVLNMGNTHVKDLSPLVDAPLVEFDMRNLDITDISVLKGKALTYLALPSNKVSDLSPLAGAPLNKLNARHNPIKSLAPLKGMPLSWLNLQGVPDLSEADADVIISLPLRSLLINKEDPQFDRLLTTHPTLKFVEGVDINYVKKIHAAYLKALQGDITAIKNIGFIVEGKRYLFVPWRLRRDQSDIMLKRFNASHATLNTLKKFMVVSKHIKKLTSEEGDIHANIHYDVKRKGHFWADGSQFIIKELPETIHEKPPADPAAPQPYALSVRSWYNILTIKETEFAHFRRWSILEWPE